MLCEFTIRTLTPSLNTWQRTNRFAKTRIREVFAWECRANRPLTWKAPPYVHVSLCRVAKRLLDLDNLYGGAKSAVDGLRDSGFIQDDSPSHIDLRITQEVTKGLPHMRIRLETR